MKGKKLITTVLACTLALSTSYTAFGIDSAPAIGNVKAFVSSTGAKSVNSDSKTTPEESAAKINKDQAKEIALKMLKDKMQTEFDESKMQFRVEYRQDYEMREKCYVWSFSWNTINSPENLNVNVDIDADKGQVRRISVYQYNQDQNSPLIASITEDQAKDLAEKFINSMNPEEFKQTKAVSQNAYYGYKYYATNYNFRYIRTINDIPFENNYMNVEVDGVTGKVRSYSFTWNEDKEIPSAEKVISKEEAEKSFKDSLNMNLMYLKCRDQYGYEYDTNKTKLVYAIDFGGASMLDAVTGNKTDYSNRIIDNSQKFDLTAAEKQEFINKAKVIEKLPNELDKASAEALIKEKAKELFGEGIELMNLNYQEGSYDYYTANQKTWSGEFRKTTDDKSIKYGGDGSITIDATTGSIISLYNYEYYDKFMGNEKVESKLTWNEAYKAALGVIAKNFPDKIKDIKTEQMYYKNYAQDGTEIQPAQYYFTFPRLVNGIMFGDDSISVSYDARTGEIRNIYSRWGKDNIFDSTEGIRSAEEAKIAFFKDNFAELSYVMIPKYGDKSDVYGTQDMEIKLVYRLQNSHPGYPNNYLDAKTLGYVGYNGEDIDFSGDNFKEAIKGNEHEKEFKILASQGIIETKNFDFNKEITRTDFIKMLVNLKGYSPYMIRTSEALKMTNVTTDSADYKYLQLAVVYGIIENQEVEYKGDEIITKEEMVKSLIKYLGYEKLAKLSDIFVLSSQDAADISADIKGYVAIAKGLNIISEEDGKLNLKGNVNMTEAAVAIYNTLSSLPNGFRIYQ